MTIPAGWYDDGSGRQRWWDGSGWTEHTVSTEPATPRPVDGGTTSVPEGDTAAVAPDAADPQARVESQPSQTADAFAPPYVLSPTDAGRPVGYAPYDGGGGQYGTTPYAGDQYGTPSMPPQTAVDGAPRRARVSVLGIVGLSVVALGVVVSCIPPVSVIGWALLGAGFVVSVISLFLRGAKWPGIAGIALSVLGGILAAAVALLTLAAAGGPIAVDDDPTPLATPGTRPTDPPSSEPSPAAPVTPAEGTDTVTFEELEVGQCLPFIEWEDEVSELPVVPCDQPHTDEVYLIFDAPDGDFPGDDALQSIASERCETAFGDFVGLPYMESELDMYWFVPTQMSWNRANDRAIQCIAFSYEDVTGTLRGAAR